MRSRVLQNRFYLLVLLAGLAFAPFDGLCESLRIGLAHQPEAEIRCDGDLRVAFEGGTSPVNLPPGVYTIRVAEIPDLYRAAPLVAGIVAAPQPSLVAVGALRESQTLWFVELLRTDSTKSAERALSDAKKRLGVEVATTERGGWIVVQAGPFPNEFLAQQILGKAQRAGFRARIFTTSALDIPEGAGMEKEPRQVRRLLPEGRGLSLPEKSEFEVEIPGGKQGPAELPPLGLIPQEELSLEPLPTLKPEELLVEPLPEPNKAELGPEVGYVPAPKAESVPPRKVPKVKVPELPRRRFQPGPARRGGLPFPSGLVRPTPLPTLEGTGGRGVVEPQRIPEPRPTPGVAVEPTPPARAPAPPSEKGRDRVFRQGQPPRVGSAPPSVAPKPTAAPYVFLPKEKKSWFPGSLKSFPIIRRFWWEPPLVGPPPEPGTEEAFEDALRRPAKEGPGEPAEVSAVASVPGETEGIPERFEVPPTPKPFNPEALREVPTDTTSRPAQIARGEGPSVAPYPEVKTEKLEKPPSPVDEERLLLPPSPGAGVPEAPPFVSEEGEKVLRPETEVEPVPGPVSAKRITLPSLGPLSRAYVQILDEDGNPKTDPVPALQIGPLTGSRLEYGGHGYHGTFEAYAPAEDYLVLVNLVGLEDYIAGIVPQEIPPDAPLEVLKAQAVLSRCYALLLAQSGDYAAYGYDIPGTPDSEWPYAGRDLETPDTRQAAIETAGEVLIDPQGDLATPVFCFSSGGYVADAQSIWGGGNEPVPDYLTARPDFDTTNPALAKFAGGFADNEKLLEEWLTASPDTYDKRAADRHFRWTKKFSPEGMDALVNDYWQDQVGHVESVTITKRAISGHATEMVIEGSLQTVTVRDSSTIRESFDLDSSLIIVKKHRLPAGWTIEGGGYGHGVGLSQCGAIGLLQMGTNYNYRHVLNFYFDQLRLGKRSFGRGQRGA